MQEERSMNRKFKLLGALAALGMMTGSVIAAEQYHDTRYHNDHFYPARGATVRSLPRGHVPVYDRGHNAYYFHGGVWYRPYGGSFVVVGPPIGVFVPVLPPYYTTVWVGGYPYYYANDTYYSWDPTQRQYEVVAPPDESAASTDAPPAANAELYSYPKNGQSPEQQQQDRYECHRWAVSQSGFDPTQNASSPPPPPPPGGQSGSPRDAYQHAMSACLEGRGYSVK
jgi:hypothetical protein